MSEVDLKELALTGGLSEAEWDHLLETLGRDPTPAEVGVVSAMWSEHCSYKSSRVHLRKLPNEGSSVVQGPGENAGAVDIGDGKAAVFKMESHNHPSYIEPYQGAATGIGGILRDVFTMGARPIGLLNSLRFGAPEFEKTPYLFQGVVDGIAGYGNCVGVPTVGGDVYFDDAYNQNILVNVFAVGVTDIDDIFYAEASGVGNPVFYVGAKTGRDGIHGATMASEEFSDEDEEKRPTVQVGDPFKEKLLIEACLDLMETDAIVGIQDMGAAGLTSSAVEMAERGEVGLRIDVDKVPAREPGMTAYEYLLSESQERMLVVVEEGREQEVSRVFDKWELEWAKVGEVIEDERFEVQENGDRVVDLDVPLLTSAAPMYDRPTERPAYLDDLSTPDVSPADDLGEALSDLLNAPNITSKRRVYEQYDHMVGVGTVVRPGDGDAAVLRVPGTDSALAIAVDCNSRYCYVDPREGAKLAVAECARNLACVGAEPAGTTDCLNFGNPENPEIMWQFVEAVEGMADACATLNAPVVSGNVSLYNATGAGNIYPTPNVAMVGHFDGALDDGDGEGASTCGSAFRNAGDAVLLLGETDPSDVGASEYLKRQADDVGGAVPTLDLEREVSVQETVRTLVRSGTARSAHDCSEGGLGVALAESCIGAGKELGLDIDLEPGDRPDLELFAESPSRVVVSCRTEDIAEVVDVARSHDVPVMELGAVTGDGRLRWGGLLDVAVSDLRASFESGLDRLDEDLGD
jgi:phosphoribosylformylglycinamidine synthase